MSIKSIFMAGTRYIKDFYYQDAHIWKSINADSESIDTYALHYDANNKINVFSVGVIKIGPNADPTRTKIYTELNFNGERYYMVLDPTLYEDQAKYSNIQGTLAYLVKTSDVAEIQNGGVNSTSLTHLYQAFKAFITRLVVSA